MRKQIPLSLGKHWRREWLTWLDTTTQIDFNYILWFCFAFLHVISSLTHFHAVVDCLIILCCGNTLKYLHGYDVTRTEGVCVRVCLHDAIKHLGMSNPAALHSDSQIFTGTRFKPHAHMLSLSCVCVCVCFYLVSMAVPSPGISVCICVCVCMRHLQEIKAILSKPMKTQTLTGLILCSQKCWTTSSVNDLRTFPSQWWQRQMALIWHSGLLVS